MNVKANMKISQIPEINKFFVCGGGGDLSLCMGACYAFAESQSISSEPLKDLYLGMPCKYSKEELTKNCHQYTITDFHDEKQIVDRLLDGKIIAVCTDRAEMGPRALCNRSIIADPRNKENIQKINRKIKNRDFWMPFAPVILNERKEDYLVSYATGDSPCMTIGFETTELAREHLKGALHPYDFTARPQILKKSDNLNYYNLIKSFEEKTGIGGLLNTSFNDNGQPIVETRKQAIDTFNNIDLDYLCIGNYIINKNS